MFLCDIGWWSADQAMWEAGLLSSNYLAFVRNSAHIRRIYTAYSDGGIFGRDLESSSESNQWDHKIKLRVTASRSL